MLRIPLCHQMEQRLRGHLQTISFQLHRLVFSLRHSRDERKDLDWEQEEKGRRAWREAEERRRENNSSNAGKKVSHRRKDKCKRVVTHPSSPHQLKRKKSLASVVWLVGSVAEAAPRPTIKTSLRNLRRCPTSVRTRCGSTPWTLMRSL